MTKMELETRLAERQAALAEFEAANPLPDTGQQMAAAVIQSEINQLEADIAALEKIHGAPGVAVADVAAASGDDLLTVEAVVTLPPGVVGTRTFAVQQVGGGAGVFVRAYGSDALPRMQSGDIVRVVGRPKGVTRGAPLLSSVGKNLAKTGESKPAFEERDLSEIDEASAGMAVTLCAQPAGVLTACLAFFAFRFFDVLKPFPARRAEGLRGGFGVVADDVLAGVYANLAVRAATWALGRLL